MTDVPTFKFHVRIKAVMERPRVALRINDVLSREFEGRVAVKPSGVPPFEYEVDVTRNCMPDTTMRDLRAVVKREFGRSVTVKQNYLSNSQEVARRVHAAVEANVDPITMPWMQQ